jgi:hypothetical protein
MTVYQQRAGSPKAYRIHANSLSPWKQTFLDRGPEIVDIAFLIARMRCQTEREKMVSRFSS